MKFSRMTARGQTTIPKRIREEAGLYEGDMLAFEAKGDHLVVRKVMQGHDESDLGVSVSLSEWTSPEDEDAWRDL